MKITGTTTQKKCPSCRVSMTIVVSHQVYGQHLELDQCPRCGGVWFDDLEIYTVHPEALKELEHIDIGGFVQLQSQADTSLSCPRMHGSLEEFAHEKFAPYVEMNICHECHGVWVHHISLSSFVGGRDARRRENAEKEMTEGQKVLQNYMRELATEGRVDELLHFTDVYHGGSVDYIVDDTPKSWAEMTPEEKKASIRKMSFEVFRINPWLGVMVFVLFETLFYIKYLGLSDERSKGHHQYSRKINGA